MCNQIFRWCNKKSRSCKGVIIQTTRLVWAVKIVIKCLLFQWLLQSSVYVPTVSIIFQLLKYSGSPKYLCGLMSPLDSRKWTSAMGTRQFTMAFGLPSIVIKLDLVTIFHGDCPSVLPCPKTQEHQSTCVDSWVHKGTRKWTSAIGKR